MRRLAAWSMTLALTLASGAAASAQSLADVARQEEERRKTVGAAAKVYTNDQLRPAPPVSAPTPVAGATVPKPAESQPSAASPAGDSAKPADQAVPTVEVRATEEAWRKRVAAEREAVSRSQILADALQSRISALTTDFENRGDPAQRNVIFADRQKAIAELARVKQEIEQHQKAIVTIQEEARRAGVPAGWTR